MPRHAQKSWQSSLCESTAVNRTRILAVNRTRELRKRHRRKKETSKAERDIEEMRGIKILFIVYLLVLLLESSSTDGWLKFPRRRKRLPPIRLPIKPTIKATTKAPLLIQAVPANPKGLPLCKSRQDINKILQQKSRTKRQTSWPYECRYASIVKYQGNYQFIWPIHDCCTKCDFPAFTACVAARSSSPSWVCPSEGLHCIVDCVKKHGPSSATTDEVIKPGIKPGIIQPSVVKPGTGGKVIGSTTGKFKCTVEKKINGKKCIEQLCVPLLKS